MKQYREIKSRYPDAILLFRVGDFYETFGPDAVVISKILGIVLTKRNIGHASEMELAGFPYHSLDSYLPRLVKTNYRIAICEQLEDPKKTKKIVKRGVVELVTPGVQLNDSTLKQKEYNFLSAVFLGKQVGIALLDASTGGFWISEGTILEMTQLVKKLSPSEILVSKTQKNEFIQSFGGGHHCQYLMDWAFDSETSSNRLKTHFQIQTLQSFGIHQMNEAIRAAGAVLYYLGETHHHHLDHITDIKRIEHQEYVGLDVFTLRNLEIFSSISPEGQSLIDIIDQTQTPMGGRQLRSWVRFPLKEKAQIQERHKVVESFLNSPDFLEDTRNHLVNIADLERMASKIATAKITPRQLVFLSKSLKKAQEIIQSIEKSSFEILKKLVCEVKNSKNVIELIDSTLLDQPAQSIAKGKVIADGFSRELDELRLIQSSAKSQLNQMLESEIQHTGISSLKISQNNVFGFYFEVRNTYKNKVPENWVRKQTLVNGERYINDELKEFESKILNARENIHQIETSIFNQLIDTLKSEIAILHSIAKAIAQLDCLSNFAVLASKNNYVQPVSTTGTIIDIKGARHPVIEAQLDMGNPFICNDIFLDKDRQQIIMITGPNMSGKSVILRQTALIFLLGQIGSYVPADAATLPVVDKIFTRVGASDNISMGESTFMVEMNETANILNTMTSESIILLDEIGRGTSTYDGISIAWAITQYLHQHPYKPWVLFATHYHELNELTNSLKRVKNFNVSVKESKDKVTFLRKLVPGGSAHSFGIHVAKMAGLPKYVIQLAKQKLLSLEETHKESTSHISQGMRLTLFDQINPLDTELIEKIAQLKIDQLTPLEALMKLNDIQKEIQKRSGTLGKQQKK